MGIYAGECMFHLQLVILHLVKMVLRARIAELTITLALVFQMQQVFQFGPVKTVICR